jgi:cytochrome b561
MLGGTWGLHRTVVGDSVVEEGATSTGTRILAAVVVVLLLAAVLIVLARVGLWQSALVPSRMSQFFAWALAALFLLETLAAFTWSREHEWWMYGPVSLVIGVHALAVAWSGGGWPRSHRSRPSH